MSRESESKITLEGKEKSVFKSLAEGEPIDRIVRASGVPKRAIEGVLRSAKILIQHNDSAVDDFLDLVEHWGDKPHSLFFSQISQAIRSEDTSLIEDRPEGDGRAEVTKEARQAIIDQIEAEWSPTDMRELGASLIRLADALDQDWSPEQVQASFHWPSAAAQIERNSLELAKKATLLKRQIAMRKKFLPSALLGEPMWNMLLELFCQFAGGAQVSTKSLSIAADCPESSALRYIAALEEHELIRRSRSIADRRVTMVELTKKGIVSVGRVLERITI